MPDRRVVPAPSIEQPDIDRLALRIRDVLNRHVNGDPSASFHVALDELVALARGDENFVRAEAAEAERASMEYRAEAAEARIAELQAALREIRDIAKWYGEGPRLEHEVHHALEREREAELEAALHGTKGPYRIAGIPPGIISADDVDVTDDVLDALSALAGDGGGA